MYKHKNPCLWFYTIGNGRKPFQFIHHSNGDMMDSKIRRQAWNDVFCIQKRPVTNELAAVLMKWGELVKAFQAPRIHVTLTPTNIHTYILYTIYSVAGSIIIITFNRFISICVFKLIDSSHDCVICILFYTKLRIHQNSRTRSNSEGNNWLDIVYMWGRYFILIPCFCNLECLPPIWQYILS